MAGVALAGVCLSAGGAGVKWFNWKGKPVVKAPEDPKAKAEEAARLRKTEALPGTVGSICYVEGLRSVFVQGYGLVAGLHGTGSAECPEQLRKDLTSTIIKYQKISGRTSDTMSLSEVLDSRNAAVVRVSGNIRFGSVRGDHFDLTVEALPNTGTTSLEGGRLYTCDLRMYTGQGGASSNTRIYGHAEGPVFINPFEKKKDAGKTTRKTPLHREGRILGGGTNGEERKLSLVLNQPSYPTARAIERKINSLFSPPADDPLWQTAKAVSQDRVDLHVPRRYRNQMRHFLGLVLNIYIRSDPSFLETTANELTRQVADPTANGPAIAYAWEALGRTTLPMIQPLYASANQQAAFYSAKAGARLGDAVAMEQLGTFAKDPKSKYRLRAIRTLGFCPDSAARQVLRELLDDPDLDIRILAYTGLARWGDMAIGRSFVGEENLVLDVVKSKAWPIVYATRVRQAKVVLFGNIKIEPPVFYSHPDNSITLSANTSDKQLVLLRTTPSGKSSGKIECPLDLSAVITLMGNDAKVDEKTGQVYGLGLPYSQVVTILNQLCKNGSISAKFKLQDLRTTAEPQEDTIGRPEKD